MGALEQRARNRELGGGQGAKLPLRPEGRGPAQGEQHHVCPRGQDGRTRPRGSLRPQPWRRVFALGKAQRICRKALNLTLGGGTLEQLEARSGAGLGIVDSVL